MARSTKYLLVAAMALVALLTAALFGALGHSSHPLPALPNPNGYDDFIAAGKIISGNPSDYATLSESELQALVAQNAQALKLVRTGLARECRVPIDYSATSSAHLNNLSVTKRLAQLLVAEGRLAELEKRPGDAVQSYLTAVRLGCEVSRGGLLINSLVSIAIQAVGSGPLEKLAPGLNATQCRELAAALEAAEARQDSAAAILQQEKDWSRKTFGFRGAVARVVTFKSQQQTEQRFLSRFNSQQTRLRLLLLQLAARAFELEKGNRPTNSADLVPVYLKTVPKDPLTGADLRVAH